MCCAYFSELLLVVSSLCSPSMMISCSSPPREHIHLPVLLLESLLQYPIFLLSPIPLPLALTPFLAFSSHVLEGDCFLHLSHPIPSNNAIPFLCIKLTAGIDSKLCMLDPHPNNPNKEGASLLLRLSWLQ